MSLLKLLTTGKSLVGLKDAESRYRMTSHRLVPKFGSAKNPFREVDGGVIESIQAAAAPEVEKLPVSEKRAPGTDAAGAVKAREGTSFLRLGASKCRDLAAGALQNRWMSQLGSLLSRPARKPAKAATVPVPAKQQPLQGELSLDRIKVMRNDLRDADLEIVAAKPKARIVAKPARPAKETTEPAGAVQKQAGERILSEVNQ